MSYALLKHQLLIPVRKYLEARGFKIESIEGDIVAARGESGTIAVKLFLKEPLSKVFEAVQEAGSSCMDLMHFDEVYVAVHARVLSRLVGKKMPVLRETYQEKFKVGLLKVREDGGVDEVIRAPRRGPVGRGGLETTPALRAPPVFKPAREALRETTAVMETSKEQELPLAAQQLRAVSERTKAGTADEGLPDFVKDNPWLVVLSKRGVKT
uniref:Uncharacterized protein n=1 Tax=Thermofilum pendens TaxID=2269 RepID=A0A7C4FDB4_THEPE